MVKIYAIIWATIAAAALLLLATGNFTLLTLIVFGFISFGMIFMGMMGVLPSTYAHPAAPAEPKKVKVKETARETPSFHANNLATR